MTIVWHGPYNKPMPTETYKVFTRGRWIKFATLDAAIRFCNDVQAKTGIILGIEREVK